MYDNLKHKEHIDIFSSLRKYSFNNNKIKQVAVVTIKALTLPPFALSLSFVTLIAIRKLNKEYCHIDKPTDVLAFPLIAWQRPAQARYGARLSHTSLGDVVVCPAQAQKNAKHIGQPLAREVCFLLVHGILHLCGYDHVHTDDEQEMLAMQRQVMCKLDKNNSWHGCVRELR